MHILTLIKKSLNLNNEKLFIIKLVHLEKKNIYNSKLKVLTTFITFDIYKIRSK